MTSLYKRTNLWVTCCILFITRCRPCLLLTRPSERQMATQKEIVLLLFFSSYSVLKTRNGWNILSSSNIIIFANMYIVFRSVNTKLVCIFYVSSSIFMIFMFYYLPFLSSVMDCSCKDPFSIILILTMIQCDSFYNSILTKDWGDVWRGGNGGV